MKNIDELPSLLTVPEAAEVLRIGKRQMYEIVKTGRIKAITFGRSIRVPRVAIEALINGHPD